MTTQMVKTAEDRIQKLSGKDRKLKRLVDALESLNGHGFTGYIKINFSQGSIGRVEKFEEILKKL